MATVQDYAFSGPFSACRGECGRAVIAAVNELCDFCRGIKAELEHVPAEQPEPPAAPVEEPVACADCGATDSHLHIAESQPVEQAAYA